MKKLLFVLPLLAIISCKESSNPKGAKFNSNGCLVCDDYEVGESFRIGIVKYQVASQSDIEIAIAEGADLTKFCTSKITMMNNLFDGYSSFNQDISSWDVSNVQNMNYMFRGAVDFNQDISNWDVSKVWRMDRMFYCPCEFDPISGLFTGGTAFNQDISSWCVTNIVSEPEFFAPKLDSLYHPVWGTCP